MKAFFWTRGELSIYKSINLKTNNFIWLLNDNIYINNIVCIPKYAERREHEILLYLESKIQTKIIKKKKQKNILKY